MSFAGIGRTTLLALAATLPASAGLADASHAHAAVAPSGLPAPALGPRLVSVPAGLASSPEEAVRSALLARAPQVRGGDLQVLSQTVGPAGVEHVRVVQEIGGVPVFHGEHAVAMRQGVPVAIVLGEVADAGSPGSFALSATEAAAIADDLLSGGAGTPVVASELSVDALAPGWMIVRRPGRPDAFARQVIFPRGPRAAWRIEMGEAADPEERWCVIVDARDGAVLARASLTSHAAARGRVYPRGMMHGAQMRDFVDADTVISLASPAGWVEVDTTLGNNAQVWEDRAGDGTATTGLTAIGTGDPLTFDFPFTNVPLDDLDAALTNVFWAVNEAHDRFWRLGFDEASGNMQTRNFSRGGVQADQVRVFVQYQAGAGATGIRNNSTASTSADGSYNSLTFGLWNRSGEIRDGAFDTGLIFHEYAHHVIVRMLRGDATCDDGNQPAGLAEGWADYFGASFTNDPVVGAWVSGNADIGIRTAAIDRSTFTYVNLCATNPNNTNCTATENGEIWAGTLWDLRSEMIRAMGPSGAEMTDRLVVEGLRYTPCRPTYIEARDGILMADLVLSGGANRCLIWQVMANRGMGYGASTLGPDDRYPTPGYAYGPECSGTAGVSWDRPRYGDDADAIVQLSDASARGVTRTVRVTSSSGDAEDFVAPAPAAGAGLVRMLTVPLRPGAASAGDGVLQVADGDTLSATCVDCPGRPVAPATVSRSLAVLTFFHQLSSETCRDDDSDPLVVDFDSSLPSLLDAGEMAVLTATLGNFEDFPLEDVRVTVTCDNPNVAVLPRGEIQVGRVPGSFIFPAPITLPLRVLVAPSPAVSFGDVATLTFDVTARGLAGRTTLRLDLAADYAAERGVPSWGGTETFEPGSPSVSGWTHGPAAGQPADYWDLQSCGRGGGRAMTYMGSSCGDYADTPSAATLVSPPLFDFSNRVQVVRPLTAIWWNTVDLGYSTATNYCDSEMVIAYFTDNPNRPNYALPRNDRNSSMQWWAQWPAFGTLRNTTGWQQATAQSAFSLGFMRPEEIRLRWVFFTDVYNPQNDGGCRISHPQGVGGGYGLDDVTFTYDLARIVPASNMTCTRACVTRTVLRVTPPGGARCAGDVLQLSAEGTEVAGCAGVIHYRFTGPGLDTGYTTNATATATAADGATWTVAARCSTDTGCNQSVSVADPTRDDSHAGRVRPGTLRVSKQGDDVVVAWDGTRAPPSYALFRGDVTLADGAARVAMLADLALTPPADPWRAGSADATTWRDAGAVLAGPGLSTYRVTGRVPCAGTALDR